MALVADGSYVAVAETAAGRLHRVRLTGERAGRAELFVDGLDRYPDNLALVVGQPGGRFGGRHGGA